MRATRSLDLTGRYYRLFPSFDAPLGAAEEPLRLPISETALLLIDVYGLAFDDRPSAEVPGIYAVDEETREIVRTRIASVKTAARAAGLTVIYVTNHLSPTLSERSEWRNVALRSCGVDVLAEWPEPNEILAFSQVVAPDPDDVVVHKQFYSGFFETSLDDVLRSRGIKDLVVVGFDSRICLGSTVTDAVYRNYRVIVLRDCIRTYEFPETREGGWANFLAVRYIETSVGYTATSADFVAAADMSLRVPAASD